MSNYSLNGVVTDKSLKDFLEFCRWEGIDISGKPEHASFAVYSTHLLWKAWCWSTHKESRSLQSFNV